MRLGLQKPELGTLTLTHSIVSHNHVAVTPPNGRFAPGGGIAMVGGTLTITDSRVSDNTADASSAVPSGVDHGLDGWCAQLVGNGWGPEQYA